MIFGARDVFAIDLERLNPGASNDAFVNFYYWFGGRRIGTGEPVDARDLHLSYLRLTEGVSWICDNRLFYADSEVLASYLQTIGRGAVPLNVLTAENIMTCSLWFHQCVGDANIIACSNDASVRIFASSDTTNQIVFDGLLKKELVDDILISAGATMGALADGVNAP